MSRLCQQRVPTMETRFCSFTVTLPDTRVIHGAQRLMPCGCTDVTYMEGEAMIPVAFAIMGGREIAFLAIAPVET